MPTPMKPSLTAIPMPIFLAMVRSSRERTLKTNAQNSPNNDGRTGFIVDYFA